MSSMLQNPQTASGMGGAGFISAPPTDDPNYQIDPVAGFSLPQNNMLPMQMNFGPDAPAGVFTDAQYFADDAALRQQIGQQYATLLQQLGYQDPTSGAIIPGTVVQDANIQMAQYQQALQDQARQVIGNLQNQGTLFSGQRGQQMLDAQNPTLQNMGQLTLNTGRSLQDLYHQAQGLMGQYNTTQNQNLASAAARNLAAIQAQQLIAAQNASHVDQSGTSGQAAPSTPNEPVALGTDYGQGAGYHPTAPTGGGGYTPSGGSVYYQSNKGPLGKKPMF